MFILVRVHIRVRAGTVVYEHEHEQNARVSLTLEVRDVLARLRDDGPPPIWRVLRRHARAIDRLLAATGGDCHGDHLLARVVRDEHRAALVPTVLPPGRAYDAQWDVDDRIYLRMWDVRRLVCGGDPVAARMFLEGLCRRPQDLELV